MFEQKTLDPESFDQAFKVLSENASRLQADANSGGGSVKIDELLPIVEQSTAAYRICKNRLDAVTKALEAHLGSNNSSSAPALEPDGDDDPF